MLLQLVLVLVLVQLLLVLVLVLVQLLLVLVLLVLLVLPPSREPPESLSPSALAQKQIDMNQKNISRSHFWLK